MSIQRIKKLNAKINECLDKNLHPKVIRRLENKLRSALYREDNPLNVVELHRLLQSARATLLNILNLVEIITTDEEKNRTCEEVIVAANSRSLVPYPEDDAAKAGESLTVKELWGFYRYLTYQFTKMDSNTNKNVVLLCGLLSSLNNRGSKELGLENTCERLEKWFSKCGILEHKIMTLILGK